LEEYLCEGEFFYRATKTFTLLLRITPLSKKVPKMLWILSLRRVSPDVAILITVWRLPQSLCSFAATAIGGVIFYILLVQPFQRAKKVEQIG
jgi:hypothetical protein